MEPFHSISSPPPFSGKCREITCSSYLPIYSDSSICRSPRRILRGSLFRSIPRSPGISKFPFRRRTRASCVPRSFLFPGNFDRRLSTIAPVMATRHEYIYIYIYRGEIGTRCDSPGEQGRGQRGAWGLDILYPSAVFRERISESKVCRRSIRQRRGAASCVHAHDTMHSKRPSLLIRAPLYPNTALERLWSGGIRADSRVIHG